MRAFCTMLIAGAIAGSTSLFHAQAVLVNGVEAVVHDSVVTFGEVQTMSLPAEQMLRREYVDQTELFQKKLSDARNDSLEQLLERQLILHDFNSAFDKPEKQQVRSEERRVGKECRSR